MITPWPAIEISDAIPPGSIYFIPPDVSTAVRHATEATARAFEALLVCWIVSTTVETPSVWRLVVPCLLETAEKTAQAATYAMAGAELLIQAAGREKRIGAIINLGV